MENVTLNQKEQTRLQVLNGLLAEQITLDQAAELMAVSSRHARRMLAAYQDRGAASLAHGHRGHRPVNATSEAVIADVVCWPSNPYSSRSRSKIRFAVWRCFLGTRPPCFAIMKTATTTSC